MLKKLIGRQGKKLKTEVKKSNNTRKHNYDSHHARWKAELLKIKNVPNNSDL